MARVSQVHSLLVNLKLKSGNWCVGRERRESLKDYLPRLLQAF